MKDMQAQLEKLQTEASECALIASVPSLKFGGLEIDSMIAESSHFGEDWLWVDALLRCN
jgi:hypothetical protein